MLSAKQNAFTIYHDKLDVISAILHRYATAVSAMCCPQKNTERVLCMQDCPSTFFQRLQLQLYQTSSCVAYQTKLSLFTFQLPKKWEDWNGVLSATKAKERCIQVSKAVNKRFIGSETCHYLNVFTPTVIVNSTTVNNITVFLHADRKVIKMAYFNI